MAMKTASERGSPFALDDLLHPAQAFGHPSDVVADPDLTVNEKRAILAAWAADAGADRPVRIDAILKALRTLDQRAARATTGTRLRDWNRRQARRQSIERFRRR